MTTFWKVSKLRPRDVIVILFGLYVLNYLITPVVVGEKLELYFRPRFNEKFDQSIWVDCGLTGSKEYGRRYEMVDNLLTSKTLFTLDQEQLRKVLGKPDSISTRGEATFWFFDLADQSQYPAQSVWFPWRFANFDRWKLEIQFRGGIVFSAKIFFT